jgi:SNF2 family DNA or RNA helicase
LFLKDYQIEGIHRLFDRSQSLLCDEMGIGKTIQALVTAKYLLKAGIIDRVLIIVPAFLIGNWAHEMKKWLNAHPNVMTGSNYNVDLAKEFFWNIISYNKFTTVYQKGLLEVDRVFTLPGRVLLICDEAHKLSNTTNKSWLAVSKFKCDRLMLITGTPIYNKPENVFGLLKLLDSETPPYEEWEDTFCVTQRVTKCGTPVMRKFWDSKTRSWGRKNVMRIVGYKNLDLLSVILNRFMIKRTAKEVGLDLPEFHTKVIYYDHGIVKSKIDSTLDPDNAIVTVGNMLRLLNGIYEKQPITVHKTQVLREIIKIHEKHKIIIWVTEYRVGKMLADDLQKPHKDRIIGFHQGKLSMDTRYGLIDDWKASKDGILFLTIGSAGVGLNMVEGSTQIFYSLPFTYTEYAQACARLHRIGQTETVRNYVLVATGTIEEALWEMVKRKKDYTQSIEQGTVYQELYNKTLKLM